MVFYVIWVIDVIFRVSDEDRCGLDGFGREIAMLLLHALREGGSELGTFEVFIMITMITMMVIIIIGSNRHTMLHYFILPLPHFSKPSFSYSLR
jgi:hypothetical protein